MSKKRLAPLIPPDLNQCQAEILGGSFMTLGPRPMIRCKNSPVWIARENTPGEDGRKGSMSLCADCTLAMIRRFGKDYCTFKPIK